MEEKNRSRLIVFVKNPRKGEVKTRLAADVGEKKALTIYHQLLDHTRIAALSVDVNRQVWYADEIDTNDEWSNDDFSHKVQWGDDLGERMHNAFESAFEEGCQKVVIIGSDCPELTPIVLEQAFRTLDNSEVVIGPARDGGYYLLGMKRLIPELFEGKRWSTSTVLEDTLLDLKQLGITWQRLPELTDIDTAEDWLNFMAHSRHAKDFYNS